MEDVVCDKCGLVNDYNTNEKEFKDGTIHREAVCNGCDTHIKFLPQLDKPKTYIPFGKYKGKHTYQIDDVDYMRWLHSILDDERLKLGIEVRLRELNAGLL